MKYTPIILREILHSLIRKLGETPEQFVRRPGRDFTRFRALRFETVISPLLTMSENSVGKALIERFKLGICPAAGETAARGNRNAFPAFYRLPAPRQTLSGIPSAGGGRIRPEVRRISRGSRLLPAGDRASARLESLAFECAL